MSAGGGAAGRPHAFVGVNSCVETLSLPRSLALYLSLASNNPPLMMILMMIIIIIIIIIIMP